jgi:hypothetical protein
MGIWKTFVVVVHVRLAKGKARESEASEAADEQLICNETVSYGADSMNNSNAIIWITRMLSRTF